MPTHTGARIKIDSSCMCVPNTVVLFSSCTVCAPIDDGRVYACAIRPYFYPPIVDECYVVSVVGTFIIIIIITVIIVIPV